MTLRSGTHGLVLLVLALAAHAAFDMTAAITDLPEPHPDLGAPGATRATVRASTTTPTL
jgi:hypothetical protein